jgi:thioredoxin-like negative regulator of GroEL
MAKTLIAMNEQAKALPLLERAVQLEPTNAAAHFRLSTIYREMGRTADSQHEVEEYKKYKLLKEKLEAVFKEMQIHPAGLSANDEQEARYRTSASAQRRYKCEEPTSFETQLFYASCS